MITRPCIGNPESNRDTIEEPNAGYRRVFGRKIIPDKEKQFKLPLFHLGIAKQRLICPPIGICANRF